jgi:hypothetical protein
MNTPFTKMKYTSLFKKMLLACLVSAAIIACNTKTKEETDTPATDSTVVAVPSESELNSNQSALLKTVLGEAKAEGSIIRGVSFGDPISKVKATETFEMFEEMPDHLGYTMETPQLETIDVQYFLSKDKKVERIMVDVYLNSGDATKQLWNAGKAHFSDLYATPKEDGNIVTWNKNAVRVNMEDVSKGKDYGLKFEFFPAGSAVLANK